MVECPSVVPGDLEVPLELLLLGRDGEVGREGRRRHHAYPVAVPKQHLPSLGVPAVLRYKMRGFSNLRFWALIQNKKKSTERPLEFPLEIPYTKKKVKNG